MNRTELRAALRRQALDTALKLLDLAFGDYSESDHPTDEQREVCYLIRREYEAAKRATEVTGD